MVAQLTRHSERTHASEGMLPSVIGGPGAEGMDASSEWMRRRRRLPLLGRPFKHHLTGDGIGDAKPAAEVFKRIAEGIERRDHMRARCRHRLHAVPLAYEAKDRSPVLMIVTRRIPDHSNLRRR